VTAFVPDFAAVKPATVEQFDGSALRAFKDCHRGERCFILGNGPSLRHTDLTPLADEVTFGVNGIFYMTWQCGFTPTYYVVEDNHVFEDNLTRVNNVDAVARFFPSKYRPIIEPVPDTYFLPTDWSYYWASSEWYEKPRFSHDVARVIYAGQTVTFLNLQLAAYMGFAEIYLVGVDFDYTIPPAATIEGQSITSADDDPNHFHPDYFGKGKKWHLPKLDNVGAAMVCARQGVEVAGATIFNATLGGKLEVFPRVDYGTVVNRPTVDGPNEPAHYLLARALAQASRLGATTVGMDLLVPTTTLETIATASPLRPTALDSADVIVVDAMRPEFDERDDGRRVIVLTVDDDGAAGDSRSAVQRYQPVLVNCLSTKRAAFWTRSLFELSPDGESVIVPSLGRQAQRSADPHREFGLDDLGTLADTRSTRWAYGRALSIDQVETLAREVAQHHHSLGTVDGYVYVQSRWKATEHPKDLLTGRSVPEQRRLIGLGT
jgi:hypothetical protein